MTTQTFAEKISDVRRNQPEFQRMLDQIRDNDLRASFLRTPA
jgi:hypothetical protein